MRTDEGQNELRLKIVYAGPGYSGKTTNLRHLYGSLPSERRGRFLSLSGADERTIFFDFLPVDVGTVAGRSLRLALYTVPGQPRYRASRALILRDADGIVFVADSDPAQQAANQESLTDVVTTLAGVGRSRWDLGVVFQYNKRDLDNRLSIAELETALNPGQVPFVPAIATDGKGVHQSLKAATSQCVKRALALATG